MILMLFSADKNSLYDQDMHVAFIAANGNRYDK